MQILNLTEIRKWSKDNKFDDSWWVSVNGITIDTPVKLADVPREGDVLLLNVNSQGTSKEEWIIFRYRGYKTQFERAEKLEKERIKKLPTVKQRLALEFFGHKEEVTRQEASDLLDNYFQSPSNYGRYQDYLWDHYERIYSGRELYEKTYQRLRNQLFVIKENVPQEKIESIINEAITTSIPYKSMIDIVRNLYPEILLAESTQKRKKSEYESYNRRIQNWRADQSDKPKKGCLGFLILVIFPAMIFFALTRH